LLTLKPSGNAGIINSAFLPPSPTNTPAGYNSSTAYDATGEKTKLLLP
jgi:hypothetical protein